MVPWDRSVAKQLIDKMTKDDGDSKTNFDEMKEARNDGFNQNMFDEVVNNAISLHNTLMKLAYSTQ